jgi:hypothetical protein
MSKALAALVIAGLGVGAVVLIASTSKASAKPKTTPPASPFQFGQATTVADNSREGWVWAVAPVLNPGPVAPGAKVIAVFIARSPEPELQPVGTLVLMFAQQGDDKNSRVLLPAAAGAAGNEDSISAARAHFGV